jgi:hypothetical protein
MVARHGSIWAPSQFAKSKSIATFPRTLNGARWRRGRIVADSESSERVVGSSFWPNLRRQEVHGQRGWKRLVRTVTPHPRRSDPAPSLTSHRREQRHVRLRASREREDERLCFHGLRRRAAV